MAASWGQHSSCHRSGDASGPVLGWAVLEDEAMAPPAGFMQYRAGLCPSPRLMAWLRVSPTLHGAQAGPGQALIH